MVGYTKGCNPRIKLQVLQQPWKQGGLAAPDFYLYFLAGQLVFAHRWLTVPEDKAVIALEAAIVGSYEALTHLVFRGSSAPYPITSTMSATMRAWAVTSKAEAGDCTEISPHTPL